MKKSLQYIILADVAILLVIASVMLFTEAVQWNIYDFLAMAVLIFIAGTAINFIWSKVQAIKYKVLLCVGVCIIFILIWAEMAVGIFGTPIAGN